MINEQQDANALQTAQDTLAQAFDRPARLEAVELLQGSSRSRVTRCRVLDATDDTPQHVVVKQALAQREEIYDPASLHGPSVRLFNEWASLQFLGECFVNDSPIPRFYGGNREAGLLVMEDLGAGQGLHTLLLGNDAAVAENALVDLFKVVGRMHAVSVGKATHYHALRDALGPSPSSSSYFSQVVEDGTGLSSCLEAFGQEVHRQVEAEVRMCSQVALEPGPFAAFIHCDPCPDNCLLTPSGMKLLDFEFGQFGLALWDGSYARMHFPTCWCVNRIPLRIVERVEAAYRFELTKGCPEAGDDAQFGRAVVVGGACALLLTLAWAMPEILEHDGQWGIATKRQRVLVRLEAFARASEHWGHLPALGAAARQIESRLRDLWLREMEEVPLYPAFQ
jgi:hypothetical protein